MNSEFGKVADVKLFDISTGAVIGDWKHIDTLDDIEVDEIHTKSNLLNFSFQKSLNLTVENATFNSDALERLLVKGNDPDVVIIGENKKLSRFKYLCERTKNRRIKSKLHKRITKIDHPIFNEGIKMKYSQITFN